MYVCMYVCIYIYIYIYAYIIYIYIYIQYNIIYISMYIYYVCILYVIISIIIRRPPEAVSEAEFLQHAPICEIRSKIKYAIKRNTDKQLKIKSLRHHESCLWRNWPSYSSICVTPLPLSPFTHRLLLPFPV